MLNKLEAIFMPLAEKIGKNKYLISIRDGFLLTTPLLIIGSFFLLIANFPINNWTEFWARFFGENWTAYMAKPTNATFDIMAILAVVGIAYSFARELKVDKLSGAAVALVSWFILMPYKVSDGSITLAGSPLNWIGSKGIFIGIITAFVSVHIYAWVIKKGWVIKMPNGVPPAVTQSFAALVPSTVVIGIFFLVNSLLALTPYNNAFELVFRFLQEPLLILGNTLGAVLVAMGFQHLFWFFGINGGSIVGSIMQPILTPLSMENLEAFKLGGVLPNVINQQFYDLFTTFGKAKSDDFKGAEECIISGKERFLKGHELHLELFKREGDITSIGSSVLLMHAEDQLMSAEGFKIIAEELIESYKRIINLEKKLKV